MLPRAVTTLRVSSVHIWIFFPFFCCTVSGFSFSNGSVRTFTAYLLAVFTWDSLSVNHLVKHFLLYSSCFFKCYFIDSASKRMHRVVTVEYKHLFGSLEFSNSKDMTCVLCCSNIPDHRLHRLTS